MPRVYYVKRARKKNQVADVGEPYYWWKFAFGPKMFSKTPPKRSQLTRSEFLSNLYDLQDGLANRFTDLDTIEDDIQELIDELNDMQDQCQDSLDNMPEHLQETSEAGQTLQERIDNIDYWVNDLEQIDKDVDPDLSEEQREERLNDIVDEIMQSDQYF